MDPSVRNDSSGARRGAPKMFRHRLPVCDSTGLARYRDRHQARDGAKALAVSSHAAEVSTFACPDCRGYHLEKASSRRPIGVVVGTTEPAEAFTASVSLHNRRYVLVDVENPTCGAKATTGQVAAFWTVFTQQVPGVAPNDHVVVGAGRGVARRYRAAIHGANVKWVVGADTPDGADRALLAAIDLRRVARDFDELVIVSGDHAFADLARRARGLGLTVQVVTAEHPEQRSMLSRELAAAANIRTRVRLEPLKPRCGNDVDTSRATRDAAPRHIAA